MRFRFGSGSLKKNITGSGSVRFGFIDLKFNCRYSFRPEKEEKLLILLELDRLSDDITMHIVWFLLQIIVKFAHLNQW